MCARMPPIWGNFLVKIKLQNFAPEGKMWKIFTYKKPSSGRNSKFGLDYATRHGPVSNCAKFGDYIFNGLGWKCRTVFGSGQMAGVKMYFDTRAPHIAPKSLKRSLAPGLLNSSTFIRAFCGSKGQILACEGGWGCLGARCWSVEVDFWLGIAQFAYWSLDLVQ